MVEIEDPKEISKGDKQLTRWNWMIVDPLEQKRIHAVLWNDKIKPDYSLVGKTVLLSRFALHNYNGSLTLNSKARSSIQEANYPPYEQYYEQVMANHKSYELVSEWKVKEEDTQGEVFTNLKDLGAAIDNISVGDTLRSDLYIHINRLLMKKWYYEGCPSCNKSA